MKVIEGKFGNQAPSDLSAQLRSLADAVDRGLIESFEAAYVMNGEYEMLHAASLTDGLVLATLLKASIMNKFWA